MKTRNFTRITAALLSFLMLCSVLACGKADTGEEATTTTALTTTAATASETTAEPQGDDLTPSITDDLPADLKFNNEVVTFLYREEVAGEFYSEAANGDIINDAVYESILAVEERLGVDIQTIQSIVGHADIDMTQHYLHVQESIRKSAVEKFSAAFPCDVETE